MVKRQQSAGCIKSPISEDFDQWFHALMDTNPLSPGEADKLRKVAVWKMLAAAKQMQKRSWFSYRYCKRMIAHVPFTPQQYDAVIQKVLDILQL